MTKIVSFDYIAIDKLFDFGFTTTEPWNANFGWLGYNSLNFVDNMS